MCLSNFKAIRQFKVPISWLRDFTRSYEKTSFRILRRGPAINKPWMVQIIAWHQTREKTLSDMTSSSNGNIFRVTGHLCGEFTGHRWFLRQAPVTRSFDVFFDLRANNGLSKQSWGWWFETPLRPLWRHCNGKNDGLVIDACMYVTVSPWFKSCKNCQ